MTDKAFSARQLAELWQCTPAHIYNMARDGRLKVFKIGELVRIKAEEVARIEAGEGLQSQ